jgi:hypothetical protein
MATDYFEKYPKLFYTLDNGRSAQIVPDILRRVKIVEELQKIGSYYDLYDVQDGETPEIVADKFYRDSTLHWVVLLSNEIEDPRFHWPLPYNDLVKNAVAKYGSEDAIHEIHHAEGYRDNVATAFYEDSNFILAPETLSLNDPIRIIFEGEADVQRTPVSHRRNSNITRLVTNIEYELEENEKRRRIRVMKPALVEEVVARFNALITE